MYYEGIEEEWAKTWYTVPCLACKGDIAYFRLSGRRHDYSVLDTCTCRDGEHRPGGVIDRLAKLAED